MLVRKRKREMRRLKFYNKIGRFINMKEPDLPIIIPMKPTKKDNIDEPSTWTGYYTPDEYLHIVKSNVFVSHIE